MKRNKWGVIACLSAAVLLFGNSIWIQAKAHLAQGLIADAWTTTLHQNANLPTVQHAQTPWPWADTYPVAQLRLPVLGIHQYVLNGANGSPLAFAPGLYAGTALPKTGAVNLHDPIIAGHHDTHFRFLPRVVIGDMVEVVNHRGERLAYQVSTITRYDTESDKLPTFYGGQTLQLVTCVPSFIGEVHPTGRLVVTATRVADHNQPLTKLAQHL